MLNENVFLSEKDTQIIPGQIVLKHDPWGVSVRNWKRDKKEQKMIILKEGLTDVFVLGSAVDFGYILLITKVDDALSSLMFQTF